MKTTVLFMVILNLWFICPSYQSDPDPPKSTDPVETTTPAADPKLIKRSTSSAFSSVIQPKILSKRPLSIVENGPYFINHYIYCDNLNPDVLKNIKSGTFGLDKKTTELLNFKHKLDKFHGLNAGPGSTATFTGDKEIHILNFPNSEPGSNDGTFNLPFPETTDLELNQHFNNFDIDLKGIIPPELLNPELPALPGEPASPLLPDQFDLTKNPDIHSNIDQIVQYLRRKTHTIDTPVDVAINPNGEELELPHLENHPLEHDPSKSTYDSPGAVDSYGQPIARTSKPFTGSAKDQLSSFPQNDQFVNYFNKISGFSRRRRDNAA
ncbi:uncharacterized protein LOC143201952 [Rhynchophorus ferrugineus]|uniref:uncharacterized protein LOC143201952 n=1 Tax=Rhynchophorus ferrugineus TaxID=354439 RepID=UPI003FCCB60A